MPDETSFPTDLDDLPTTAELETQDATEGNTVDDLDDAGLTLSDWMGWIGTGLRATQAKVGVDASAVTTSHDFLLSTLLTGITAENSNALLVDLIATAVAADIANDERINYWDASGNGQNTTITSYIRGLLNDADASTARATLELTTAKTITDQIEAIRALADSIGAELFQYYDADGASQFQAVTIFTRDLLDSANANAARIALELSSANAVQFAGVTNTGVTIDPQITATISGASSTIPITATNVLLDNTSGGAVTLTSAPTIPNGTNGQLIRLFGTSVANTVTIQDSATLPSSNLKLSTATFVLGSRDNITLVYRGGGSLWQEVGRTNVI